MVPGDSADPARPVPGDVRKTAAARALAGAGFWWAISGLVAILVAGTYFASQDFDRAIRQAERRMVDDARLTSELVAMSLQAADIVLLQYQAAIQTIDWHDETEVTALRARMLQSRSQLPFIGNIWLTDATGAPLVTTISATPPSASFADRPVFQLHKGGDDTLRIGSVIRGRTSNELVFNLSRRMTDRTGRFAGIALLSISVDHFARVFRDLKLGPDSMVEIVRNDLTILVREPKLSDAESLLAHKGPAFRSLIDRNSEGKATYSGQEDDIVRIQAYRQAKPFPIYALVGLSRPVVIAEWQQRALPLVGLGLLVWVMLAGGLTLLRRSVRLQQAIPASEFDDMQLGDNVTPLPVAPSAGKRQRPTA